MADIGNNPNELTDLIGRVRDILEDRAANGRLIRHGEIARELGREISRSQWCTILNPIYNECISIDDPDLTLIVVDQTGYPPFFSQGGEAQSVRFNFDRHYELWQKELERIFATWRARRRT